MTYGKRGQRKSDDIQHFDSTVLAGNAARRVRHQYIALLTAVGSPSIAHELLEDMVVWQSQARPSPKLLCAWENDWVDGVSPAEDREVKAMKIRLMSYEEWGNRRAIRAAREALTLLANDAKAGKLSSDKQVQLKYLADGVAMMTRDTTVAYGAKAPTPTQLNKFSISIGEKPQRQLRQATKVADVIDAEFHELPAVARSNEDTSSA